MQGLTSTTNKRSFAAVVAIILGIVVILVLICGTGVFAGDMQGRGANLVRDSIMRAAVLCYSTRGFYPPSLAFIEENYGVAIDHQRYLVWYEVFASNIMPKVQVVERK